jgi:hypothetical protein
LLNFSDIGRTIQVFVRIGMRTLDDLPIGQLDNLAEVLILVFISPTYRGILPEGSTVRLKGFKRPSN